MKKGKDLSRTMMVPLAAIAAIGAAEILCYLLIGPGAALYVLGAGLLLTVAAVAAAYARINAKVFRPVREIEDAAKRIAAGETGVAVPEAAHGGGVGGLAEAVGEIAAGLDAVRAESETLCAQVGEGYLEYRADVSGLRGSYRAIVSNVNGMLEATTETLGKAKEILEKYFLNDYTEKMSEEDQKGFMKGIAEVVNKMHYRYNCLLGTFLEIGEGDTHKYEYFRDVGKKCDNDRTWPAITKAMGTLRDLISETGKLAEAAVNGDLTVRGDADSFPGAYKDIIKGMNDTMEAIIGPIIESGQVLQQVASGNLTVEMTGDYKGEYNKIKESINHTIRSFNSILNDINVASSQVSAGAKQVSESSVMLSQGATEQASSVEQLTASIEEIANQTRQNAEDADQANKLAEVAKDHAEKGNNKMDAMLRSMEEINVSSDNISKIIKVIDDIAFQTNILALNAAVEAARAGQHGKGFTVVAEEVRSLAARSAKAANETTELIKNSIRSVEEGTSIANETAKALGEIVEGVTEAAKLVHNIAAASNEQSSAITQVNQGIAQVSSVVQATSATSEESATASEQLASQAEVLKEQIAKFVLRDEEADGLKYSGMSPDEIKRLEKLFEKSHIVADAPPKPIHETEEKKASSKY